MPPPLPALTAGSRKRRRKKYQTQTIFHAGDFLREVFRNPFRQSIA
jgi:hypothetical protein